MSMAKAKVSARSTSPRAPCVRRVSATPLRASGEIRRVATPILQPALKVGAANDPLEREAERTAERIVSMPSPNMAPPLTESSPSGEGPRGVYAAQRAGVDDQPSTETLEVAPPIPADHQDPDVPKEEDVDTTGLTADDMNEIESGEPEDTAAEPAAEESPPPPDDEAEAQPARSGDVAAVGAEGGAAPTDVTRRVAQPGSGRALPTTVRAFMEPRFGKDFSDVRIHDAPDDRGAARRIGARAFTHRQHIWIGPGETVENRRLMAHELTHVVQQTKRTPVPVVEREIDITEEAGEPELCRIPFANTAEKHARKVPGYRLVSVILGKSPITGDRVERNATNLLGALMAMIPGGGILFDRLMETRVIQNAFEWISGRLHDLNITWTRIKGLISELIHYLPARPSNAIRKAKSLFGPIVSDILTFIREVKDKILEFIVRGALKLAGPWAEKVWGVIQQAGGVISTILEDPLGFAKNLFRSVLKGFRQFGANVFKHIKKGLLGWLLGTIQGLDLQIPEKLDFKGILSIALQILGLTYANFRAKLVKRLGANGERKVAYLEKSVEVVKILVKEGFVGLWQRVLQMIDNFKQTVIGGIQKFVVETLIKGGLGWLAGLSNPLGAIIKVVLAIYNIIKTFLERLDQILEVAKSIFSSIGAIAAGKIQQAADFIEKTMAATVPVVISFLAALVPVTGITNAIRGIIKKLRAPVDKAMNKMIAFLVKKAKKLFSKIIGKLNKKRKLPSANFKVGGVQHEIYAEPKGKSVQVMIASGPGHPPDTVAKATLAVEKNAQTPEAKEAVQNVSGEVSEADKETDEKEKKIDLGSKRKNQNAPMEALKDEIEEGAKEMGEAANGIEKIPELEGNAAGPELVRYSAARSKLEGEVGSYKQLSDARAAEEEPKSGVGRGKTFEIDHIPTLDPLQEIQKWLKETDDPADAQSQKLYRVRVGRPPKDEPKTGEKTFGLLQSRSTTRGPGNAFPAIVLYAEYHAQKPEDKEAKNQIKQIVDDQTKDTPTKISELKTLLAGPNGHIDTEINAVEDTYKSEPIGEITDKVKKGLTRLKEQAIFDLQLTAGAKAPAPPDQEPTAGSGPRATFTFSDAANEGRHGPHRTVRDNFSRRGFIESDHIVDDALPRTVKSWTFSDLMGEQDPTLAAINELESEGERKEAEHRRENLLKRKMGSKKMMDYERDKAETVAIFAGVHDAVDDPDVGGLKSRLRAGVDIKSAVSFVKGEDGNSPDVVVQREQAKVREEFRKRFENHKDIVLSKYNEQKDYVVGLNNEKNKSAAADEMSEIIGRVRDSLQVLRGETERLFD